MYSSKWMKYSSFFVCAVSLFREIHSWVFFTVGFSRPCCFEAQFFSKSLSIRRMKLFCKNFFSLWYQTYLSPFFLALVKVTSLITRDKVLHFFLLLGWISFQRDVIVAVRRKCQTSRWLYYMCSDNLIDSATAS